MKFIQFQKLKFELITDFLEKTMMLSNMYMNEPLKP